MGLAAFRIGRRDRELWELAADREEINLSEFARRAVLERSRRVLLVQGGEPQGNENDRG